MPAAAVIPAPIAYIKVVAVKKLVVGSRRPWGGALLARLPLCGPFVLLAEVAGCSSSSVPSGAARFTLKKLECSEQA